MREVVVVGGGTAGWLAASLIAARVNKTASDPIRVTLIESPDVATIGVGEGTWPTMRRTLESIGLSEREFLVACDASFKQGSRFDGWVNGKPDDSYLHPFAPPIIGSGNALLAAWTESDAHKSFAAAVSSQDRICALGLAPKQENMPDYAGALNYGYHLDAVKFAGLLQRHATNMLGVRHVRDHVIAVESAENGDIAAVTTRENGSVKGDLFIDSSGHAALLLGGHYGVEFVDCSSVLFNDRALAVQVAVDPDSAIASQTVSTAHSAGWIWDIGLPTRRGIGCVYASQYLSDDEAAATLDRYLAKAIPGMNKSSSNYRQINFRSGHRAEFWHRNCLAVGLSAGFLEPLEASAIVLVELSLEALLDDFPEDREVMDIQAERFNRLFDYRWNRIIDFLKLHYVLSKREDHYWQDQRDLATLPPQLRDLLALWKQRAPAQRDFSHVDEVFPAASYQYVLYGMTHMTAVSDAMLQRDTNEAVKQSAQVELHARRLASVLPTNRALLNAIRHAAAKSERASSHV
ncbi:MAG: tryptophan halogenase family protein [Chakrabartia sp.]